jgi:hypothetical protein
MAEDQEWCLECGAARTTIRPAPDWRVPLVVIAVVVLIAAGAFAYALVRLTSNSGTTTAPAVASRAITPTLGSWAPGLDGWTVVLARDPTQAAARAQAQKLLHSGLPAIGVLATAQHPAMHHQGDWDVFSNRYPTKIAAQAAAATALKHGQRTAKAAEVQRPGGN